MTSGRSGDSVVVLGTTLRGENGRFAPSNRLEVWWEHTGTEDSGPVYEADRARPDSASGDRSEHGPLPLPNTVHRP